MPFPMIPKSESPGTPSATSSACIWLLAALVLLAPLGMGGSAAAEAEAPACPCKGAPAIDRAGQAGQADSEAHADAADLDPCGSVPAEDGCPPDCPDCGCCPGVLLVVLPQVAPRLPLPTISSGAPAPSEAPASGAPASIFRPPRQR